MAERSELSAEGSEVAKIGLSAEEPLSPRKRKTSDPARSVAEPDYVPPDFSSNRRTRIGASFIEQFVAGHDASDILRELVQNEFDGGGESLVLTFGTNALEVVGSGKNIRKDGWERLSVILGTGQVMGAEQSEVVAPKANGIGSKNFGLRSLFYFGDRILVRSASQVALLDLRTLETGLEADPNSKHKTGVRLYVLYRETPTEILQAFSAEREEHAFALMKAGIPDTLMKLALAGRNRGLRDVTVRSIRTRKNIRWRQEAKSERSRLVGVTVLARSGKLADTDGAGATFREIEFARSVQLPDEYRSRGFPAYFRKPAGEVKIAVSLPLTRRGVDLRQEGHFYYPLKAPTSRTGCPISINAPFELNTDRSAITDHPWNDWLMDQAVELTLDLLKADWFKRFGADAYKVLRGGIAPNPDGFIKKITERLSSAAYWPTRGKDEGRYAAAVKIVLPTDAALDGLLDDGCYLDPLLANDTEIREMVAGMGAKKFSISSLVRLRCAGSDASSLQTKVGGDCNRHYLNYAAALKTIGVQTRTATALSAFPRLSPPQKRDLRVTPSTLSATNELRPAEELMVVEKDLWDDCPEPIANRLHPDLIPFKAISGACRKFDEDQWIIDASKRARTADDDRERELLYRKLLSRTAPITRMMLNAIRGNPVVRNQRGEWIAPAEMVVLTKAMAKQLDPVVHSPSMEMMATPELSGRLRIRKALNGDDLVRVAETLPRLPVFVGRFEKLLLDNLQLLSREIVERLREVPCLNSRAGELTAPASLYLDTPTNRLCIGDEMIVAGRNEILYRRLKLKGAPGSETLLEILESHRGQGIAPPVPPTFYPALVDALARENRSNFELIGRSICWTSDGYHDPFDLLVGTRINPALGEVVPVYRHLDRVGQAYLDLGASSEPTNEHWQRFFLHVSAEWASAETISNGQRRLLLEAYDERAWRGLPPSLDEARCLVDDRLRLFSLKDLREGRLLEGDYLALQQALQQAGSPIGFIEATSRSRPFFSSLKIKPLSGVTGPGVPKFGPAGRPSLWYKQKHSDRVLAMLHRPLFALALYEIAYRQRQASPDLPNPDRAAIKAGVDAIKEISFFESIMRRYEVGGVSAEVPSEVGIRGDLIGLVAPKTKNAFQFMLAEALAQLVGANNTSAVRALASAFLPLVLCGTIEDLRDYLRRIDLQELERRHLSEDQASLTFDEEDDEEDDVEELAVRQVFEKLDSEANDEEIENASSRTSSAEPQSPRPATSSSPPELPDLDTVRLIVAENSNAIVEGRNSKRHKGGANRSIIWYPPTADEVERTAALGQRGEALVYREELERVRSMGHADPEQLVVWTSRTEPGADHDIRSIDANGRVKWIEVKSTTGVDGRFEWPKKEFEKALREREHYELWRVYQVAGTAPTAKCFRNPSRLIGARKISLELGTLRAQIEDLD